MLEEAIARKSERVAKMVKSVNKLALEHRAGETDVTLRKAAEAAERLVKEAEEKVHQMEEKLRFEHLRAKWIRADLEAGDAKSAAETHAAVADAAKLESPAKAELFGPLGR